jgi:hypothetical protein
MNKWGETLLMLVIAAYFWSFFTVLSKVANINPLLFDVRDVYSDFRGLER